MSVATKTNDQTISSNNNMSCLGVPCEIYNRHILKFLSDQDLNNMTLVCKGAVSSLDRAIATGFMNLKRLHIWIEEHKDMSFNYEISLDCSEGIYDYSIRPLSFYLFTQSQNPVLRFPNLIGAKFSSPFTSHVSFFSSFVFNENKKLFQNLRCLNLSYLADVTNDVLSKIASQCSNLIQLKLENCNELLGKISFKNYSKLENLDLLDCKKINRITLNNQSTQLKILTIFKVVIKELDFLEKAPELENLNLIYSNDLKDNDIEHINKYCTNLRKLRLDSCSMNAARLEKLSKLESLELAYCNDIVLSAQNTKLQTLLVSDIFAFNSLNFFQKAPNLKKFMLSGNQDLEVINHITQYCSNLIDLELLSCAGLVNTIFLTTLSKLQRLYLKNCENIIDIVLHPQLTSLKILHIEKLKKINSFDSYLKNIPQIEKISFFNIVLEATDLQHIFEHCSNLTKLHLRDVQLLRRAGSYKQREISLENLSRLELLDVERSDIRTTLDFKNKTYRVTI